MLSLSQGDAFVFVSEQGGRLCAGLRLGRSGQPVHPQVQGHPRALPDEGVSRFGSACVGDASESGDELYSSAGFSKSELIQKEQKAGKT